MAEESDKTEEPTPYKLQKAREKGQVAKSRDAISALIFLGGMCVLFVSLHWFQHLFLDFTKYIFSNLSNSTYSLTGIILKSLSLLFLISMPCILVVWVLAFLGNYMQVGFLYTTDPLIPDLKKINPFTGFKQLFSQERLVEFLKQLFKFSVILYLVYRMIQKNLKTIILAQDLSLESSLRLAGNILFELTLQVSLFLAAVAFFDYFWQRYAFLKKMRMSKHEIKQEYKQSEGDPELKGERKRLAYEILFHSNENQVKQADAVVINPTEIAVAIRYDSKNNQAPMVVAKGLRKNAKTIKDLAKKYHIPIIRNIPLARALSEVELEQEIPEELYQAVAEVLQFVYSLKKENLPHA